ncbi:cupin domain-containing protein [Janthinobacterium sp. Mn2066]|uniref:cupin domain-containing protein n=1 Tax=Janthinobacterium sp. Mn2066 TaxID=3395264 RepID=UPI003BBF74B7
MLIHADYTRRATVVPGQHRWSASPQGGVERMMLDRFGGEQARATSLVRYARGAHFPAHQHPGGEEILVLSGTFSADGQHYRAGSYLRNPPGSRHQPSSSDGALIFVKLWQMTADEHTALRIDTGDPACWQHHGDTDVCRLFRNKNEQVSLQRLAAGATLALDNAELLVLDGGLLEGTQHYPRHSWLRLPPGNTFLLRAGEHGATVYLKTGHLAYLANLAAPC